MIYADWRALVNSIRGIRNSPGRFAMWMLFAAVVVLFVWARTLRANLGLPVSPLSDLAQADTVLCSLAVLMFVTFAIGRNSIGIFRSRVEARFIISSRVAAQRAIAYLIVRDTILMAARYIVSFAWILFVSIPHSVGSMSFVRDMALAVAFGLAFTLSLLPRRLARGSAAFFCTAFGYALALLAAIPLVRGLLDRFFAGTHVDMLAHAFLPAWHPGAVLLAPSLMWLLAAIGLAAIALGVLVAMTADAYPELYELSTSKIDLRERVAGKRGFAARTEAARALRFAKNRTAISSIAAPQGVFIFFWRSFVEYRRRTLPRVTALDAVFWLAGGYGLTRIAASIDTGPFAVGLVSAIANVSIVAGSMASSHLALEMRRPMFWLSSAWLAERLLGFALGALWPQLARSLIASCGIALAGGSLDLIATVALGFPALIALLIGTGYAGFALFPTSIDQRGPLALARVLCSYLFLVPPLVFFVAVRFALHLPMVGLVGFALLAIAEAVALIFFAAWRLDGRIDLLAAT